MIFITRVSVNGGQNLRKDGAKGKLSWGRRRARGEPRPTRDYPELMTDVPRDIGAWPKIFMEACRTFAYQEGFEEMRVAKAASLYAYHYPGVRPDLVPDALERHCSVSERAWKCCMTQIRWNSGLVPMAAGSGGSIPRSRASLTPLRRPSCEHRGDERRCGRIGLVQVCTALILLVHTMD
jgi:hypothetical protein